MVTPTNLPHYNQMAGYKTPIPTLSLLLLSLVASGNIFTTQAFPFAPSSSSIRRQPSAPLLELPRRTRAVSQGVDFTSRSTKRKMSSSSEMPPVPDDETLTSLLDVAVRASKLAGEIILGNAGGADVLKSKANSRDLLTLIDPLCEKVRGV